MFVVQADCIMLPALINDEDRPYYVYVVLLVDENSGMVLSCDMLRNFGSLQQLWRQVPATLLDGLERIGELPGRMKTPSPVFYGSLGTTFEKLGITLELADCEMLSNATEAVLGTMR